MTYCGVRWAKTANDPILTHPEKVAAVATAVMGLVRMPVCAWHIKFWADHLASCTSWYIAPLDQVSTNKDAA